MEAVEQRLPDILRAARYAVIGIGNVLAGDDAFGPTVVRTFDAQWVVPDDVEVIDAGTPGLDLTAYLVGLRAVVLVDAIRARGSPGELRVLDGDALQAGPPVLALSPHQPGVREAVLHAELAGGSAPLVRLVGAVTNRMETGIGLSEPVRAAIPRSVRRVVEELRGLGVRMAKRVPERAPDLWWERRV
jgi:hydrogenase maturation protease